MQLFDTLSATVSLAVFALVSSLIAYRLRSILAPLRNVQSMETIIWTLVGASIEAGALLVLAQTAVVVLFLLDSPMMIIAEGIATQVYVRLFSHIVRVTCCGTTLPSTRARSWMFR